nr:hypothetical protein [uncultured Draconibacterium sp.]
MKYIIFVLTIMVSISAFAQDNFLVKTDGTKYYLQVYDGETNEKVVYYNHDAPGWQTKIQVADYFDGSSSQLWSFEENPNFPGYLNVRNHHEEMLSTSTLMSYNWLAYLATDESRDPLTDLEKQFRIVEGFDGYLIIETIEKPTDGSLYGINYTPGADAMNVKDGIVSFGGVKTTAITRENMVNNVFKFVEFDPIKLFEESIVRGDDLYNDNPNAPEKARYDLFYILEKARETRVFGTDGEMLNFQPNIDEAVAKFNQALGLLSIISNARAFIDTTGVEPEIKNSFNTIVDEAEAFLNESDLSYDEIDAVVAKVEEAQSLVEAIIAAQAYGETLAGQDTSLITGLDVSITNAETVLANDTSGVNEYTTAISHLNNTQTVIDEIIVAKELIEATLEFEEAKAELTAAIDAAITTINTAGITVAELEQVATDIQAAVKAFKRALEAGDTPIELKNADFEDGLADWNVESPTPGAAYPENKGVDGSRSITFWKGADYQMKFSQTISSIPDGTYMVSCFARVSADNSIALFAESGDNSAVLPLVNEGGLTKRIIEVDVVGGMLQFGIKGAGVDNSIPAGNWIVFDEFEVKWSSKSAISNAGFEDDLTDWMVEGVTAAAYPENKGVDGSRSITCWSGSDYTIAVSQTLTGINNGFYAVSAMAKTNQDSAFVVFGESAGVVSSAPVAGNQLAKTKAIVEVKDGTLKFGVQGAGENNAVPAGRWIVFDNVEVVRMPDVPVVNSGFEEDLVGWLTEGKDGAAYAESRSVDGSRSITCWAGSEYAISVSQTISGTFNGTYAVSAIARTSQDGAFVVFGESGGDVSAMPINQGYFEKTETIAKVTDESLKFGVKGAGEGNLVPAGQWIIFDNVELKIKSITPIYEVIEPTPSKMVVTDVQTQQFDNEINYWQDYQRLNIQSNEMIVNYQVYSITGALVDQKETRTTTLSIPMRKGIFIVRVLTENGFVDTEKISIR